MRMKNSGKITANPCSKVKIDNIDTVIEFIVCVNMSCYVTLQH